MLLVQDKVVIVTGGGGGIGEATCLLFAENGAKVVVADYNFEAAKRVADSINEKQGTYIPMQGHYEGMVERRYCAIPIWVNVADREHVDSMVMDVMNTFGRIDVLINNAGITMDKTLVKMTQEQWNQVLAVNQTGVFNCGQAVAKHMVEQRYGRIINTSSIVGRYGKFGQSNYAATKAAVIALAQTWARELGGKGITANAVAPGFIATPMTAAMPPEELAKMESQVPVKRLGEPMDIANTFLFLASDMGKYVNGAVIAVDGGLLI